MIWLYTFRSGIKSIVWTDSLQTLVMLAALVVMVVQLLSMNQLSVIDFFQELSVSSSSRIFVFDDWISKQHVAKQFFSGVFIAVVMTFYAANKALYNRR